MVAFKLEEKGKRAGEISFKLKAIDTTGIGDTEGRSKKFLNQIAQTIKTKPLNLIIILVDFGKLDTGVYTLILKY